MDADESPLSRRNVLRGATLLLGTSIAGCLNQRGSGTNEDSSSTPINTQISETSSDHIDTTDTTPVVKTPRKIPTSNSTPTPTQPAKPLSPPLVSVSGTTKYGIELTGSPIIGKKNTDVPIDIYYWYDYQCRYCKQFEMSQYGAFPPLVHNEISNGTARLVLLQYPRYGKHSVTAAVMAKCLWQLVKDSTPALFWKWHHTVFKHQSLPGGEWSSRKSLLGYARNITGIDARAVDQCMRQNRKQIKADVLRERKRARKVGIKSTPGFVLYHPKTDQHISFQGAQPYPVFQRYIQKLRNK